MLSIGDILHRFVLEDFGDCWLRPALIGAARTHHVPSLVSYRARREKLESFFNKHLGNDKARNSFWSWLGNFVPLLQNDL